MNRSPLQPSLPDNATVKIIGLGGVGSIVARYLAAFLASLDRVVRLVLLDGDEFEHNNRTRMIFGSCGNKAAVTHDELAPRFAESSLSIIAIEEFVSPENISRLIRPGDIILLTVDNHATRKLVSDHCATLTDVCLISGGNDGVEKDATGKLRRGTYGNVQVYLRRADADASPSLTRYHPEIAQPSDKLPTDKSCTELITSVPQILFTNLTVATCMLNTLLLHLSDALHYSELAFDIADGLMRPAPLPAPKQSK
jgi:hypothetical protein